MALVQPATLSGGWGSSPPGLSKGGQREEVRQRFSIVGAYPLGSWRNPGTVTIPKYHFNKTKQHTVGPSRPSKLYIHRVQTSVRMSGPCSADKVWSVRRRGGGEWHQQKPTYLHPLSSYKNEPRSVTRRSHSETPPGHVRSTRFHTHIGGVGYFSTNRFVSTTKNSMKCVINWIPLRIRVRSRNTQPHLEVDTISTRGTNPF